MEENILGQVAWVSYGLDALPVTQPTMSTQRRERYTQSNTKYQCAVFISIWDKWQALQ